MQSRATGGAGVTVIDLYCGKPGRYRRCKECRDGHWRGGNEDRGGNGGGGRGRVCACGCGGAGEKSGGVVDKAVLMRVRVREGAKGRVERRWVGVEVVMVLGANSRSIASWGGGARRPQDRGLSSLPVDHRRTFSN